MKTNRQRKIVMLLSNPATFDLRPLKEAHSLARAGLSVTILAWDREGETASDTKFADGVTIKRMRLKAGHGTPALTVPKLAMFYLWCLVHIIGTSADSIHCHDVDTLPAGIVAHFLWSGQRKLVYDMHDLPEAFLRFFPMARKSSSFFVSAARRRADLVIVASEGYVPYLKARGLRGDKIAAVLNAPSLREGRETRRSPNQLNILYYGALEEERGVRQLVGAVTRLKGVTLTLAGRGRLANWVAGMSKASANIRYLGWLSISKLSPLIMDADLIPSLYAPITANMLLSTPNKLLQSFSLSIPALVTSGTHQATLVQRYGCGIVVKWGDLEEISDSIALLAKDRPRYEELAASAYRAFFKELNWEVMEARLKEGYERLLGARSPA